MPLRLHNTLGREKQNFVPLDPEHVRLYVCGPTVYDRAHIGNARPVVVFDVLFRLLQHGYPRVTYVRNITDVDDKINTAARDRGLAIEDITRHTTQHFHDDMAALNTLPPTIEPRATAHIPQMINMVETLIQRGHAYAAEGHVLFDVPSMIDYGRLSGRNREEMLAGARVEIAPYKKDPADFVLWKPSDQDTPGWDSPWGRGRPGWHLECSAMSATYLGETFDLHGGGQDLIFPHHENEIAQSQCAHGKDFVRYWVHNGYVVVEGEKMSKSLGNFITVQDLLDQAPGEAVRYALLATHYRQPLDWTARGLGEARAALDRLYQALRSAADVPSVATAGAATAGSAPTTPPENVLEALEDDLNTPLALAHLHDLAHRLNKADTPAERARLKNGLLAAGALLGLIQQDPESWFTGDVDTAQVASLIAARTAARAARDFAEADRLRGQLDAMGIVLQDGAQGTRWKRKG